MTAMAQTFGAALLLLLTMYLAPSLVAFGRRAEHSLFIAALNVALGWTILGWMAALAWSVCAPEASAAPDGETEPAFSNQRNLTVVGSSAI